MVFLKRIALPAQKDSSVMRLEFLILLILVSQVISVPNLVTLKSHQDVIRKMPLYVRLDITVTMDNNEDLALQENTCLLRVRQLKVIVSTVQEIVPMKR